MYGQASDLERVQGVAHFGRGQLASLQETMAKEKRHGFRRLGGADTICRGQLLRVSRPTPIVELDLTYAPLEDKGKYTTPFRLSAIGIDSESAVIMSYLTDEPPPHYRESEESENVSRFAFVVNTQVRGAQRGAQSVRVFFAPDGTDRQTATQLLLPAEAAEAR